ncbi:MAG: hypothetical protein K0S46_2320 [Moraxellaceae bacterium]|nr:hypothetical protein [Moraxellaceae bacterium]
MRRLMIALAMSASCLGSLSISPLATAAPAAPSATAAPQSLRSVQQLETLSYQAATTFYLHSVLNRDPEQMKKTQANLTAGDALVKSLANPAISAKWSAFKQSISSARFTSEGVPDNDSLNVIDGAHTALTLLLRSNRTEQRLSANVATDKMADMLYDQHVLMHTMTAAYLRKSADYFGGAIVQSQAPQVEIDQLANKFTAQLNMLTKHYARNAEVALLLREVNTKWLFIRNSFINFNENNVPFIVGRYNDQITQKLLEAYAKLSQ